MILFASSQRELFSSIFQLLEAACISACSFLPVFKASNVKSLSKPTFRVTSPSANSQEKFLTLNALLSYLDNQGLSSHLKVLNLTASAKSLLSCKVSYSQVLCIRTWKSVGTHYSTYNTNLLPFPLRRRSSEFDSFKCDLCVDGTHIYIPRPGFSEISTHTSKCLLNLHSPQPFFPKSSLFPQMAPLHFQIKN